MFSVPPELALPSLTLTAEEGGGTEGKLHTATSKSGQASIILQKHPLSAALQVSWSHQLSLTASHFLEPCGFYLHVCLGLSPLSHLWQPGWPLTLRPNTLPQDLCISSSSCLERPQRVTPLLQALVRAYALGYLSVYVWWWGLHVCAREHARVYSYAYVCAHTCIGTSSLSLLFSLSSNTH